MYSGAITDVEGILVGHCTDQEAKTGVTAILAQGGAVAGVQVLGGGPGTRETDSMQPGRLVYKVNAILLSGGSAFGLNAAAGAMRVLEGRGEGYDVGVGKVPIVGQAVLFDLGYGKSDVRPEEDMGAVACLVAGKTVPQGNVGAGCGATVGKMAGQAVPSVMADKAGLGTASLTLPDGSHIGALVAVNAAGDVYHPETGEWMAGGHLPDGTPVPAVKMLAQTGKASDFNGNTTIGVIATDAALTREQTNRLALLAHDGYGRAIRPVHMPVDGDTVFALSTGRRQGEYMLLCALAAEVIARAIANAVEAAKA